MVCKRCQADLAENARFCPVCGALQPMRCPSCGAESRPGSRTCTACGKKLPMAEREDRLVYTKRKRSTGSLIATAAVVLGALLVLTAAVLFLFNTVFDVSRDPGQTLSQNETDVPEEPAAEPEKVPEETPETPEPPVAEPPAEEEPSEEPPAEEAPEEQPVEEEPAEEPQEEEPEQQPEEEPQEEPEQPDREPMPGADQMFFPDSDSRLLTEADIAGMTSAELRLARNEIYARHGRRFSSQDLQSWFDSCSWYEGTIAPAEFDEGVLSSIEMQNAAFLKAAE